MKPFSLQHAGRAVLPARALLSILSIIQREGASLPTFQVDPAFTREGSGPLHQLAGSHDVIGRLAIRGEHAIPIHQGYLRAHQGMACLHQERRAHRAAEFKSLGSAQQLNAEDPFHVGEDGMQLPHTKSSHADDIFLT